MISLPFEQDEDSCYSLLQWDTSSALARDILIEYGIDFPSLSGPMTLVNLHVQDIPDSTQNAPADLSSNVAGVMSNLSTPPAHAGHQVSPDLFTDTDANHSISIKEKRTTGILK